jgi:uncharacterized repeat protein (TIGR04076 family)
MADVRITVVKRLSRDEILAAVDPGCSCRGADVCERFAEGQTFRAAYDRMPEGFCPGAWADLFRFVLGLGAGADFPWMNERGVVLACCNDGFRPVVFRLERIEPAAEDAGEVCSDDSVSTRRPEP